VRYGISDPGIGRWSLPGSIRNRLRLAATKAVPTYYERCAKLWRTVQKDDIPQALRLQAAYYFGSLQNALSAMKKDQRLLHGWSKQKIVLTLCRMHRSKESLAYGRIRRENQPLLSAAEAYFGSWGKALYAAGIDPNLYLFITSGANEEQSILSQEFP
jgi:hypothetical protein